MSIEEKTLEQLERIADALETICDQKAADASGLASFLGLLHADVETIGYILGFALPPLIQAQPGVPDDAKAEMVMKVMQLLEVHRAQVKEASGWQRPDDVDPA